MKSGYLSEVFVSFQGEGAYVGQRHLFVRTAGCNMRCAYCDTPESLERTETYTVFRTGARPETRPNPVTAAELANLLNSMLREEEAVEVIAFTGGEPLAQSGFLLQALQLGACAAPVLIETNGVLPNRLREILPLVHIISMDLKLPSNTGEGPWWREHAEFLQLARAKELYVKILVDDRTVDDDIDRAVALLHEMAPAAPLFIQPILDPDQRPAIHAARLTDIYLKARQRLRSVRVLPQTHKLLGIR